MLTTDSHPGHATHTVPLRPRCADEEAGRNGSVGESQRGRVFLFSAVIAGEREKMGCFPYD